MKKILESIKKFFTFIKYRFRRYKKKTMRKFHRLKRPWQIAIGVFLIIVIAIPTFSFSRYVYDVIKDHFNMTSTFFFKSDFLSEKDPEYTITNWSGVDPYTITINMNSIKNEIKKAPVDIAYDIEVECETNVTCIVSKNNGVIYANTGVSDTSNKDSFVITVTPKHAFSTKEKTTFRVKTTSSSPYIKTISASFTLKVEKVGISYEITDKPNDVYSVLRITNSVTYYTVKEAFDSYSVGDEIDSSAYNLLSEANKKKCASASLTLSFDPRVINVDMTNSYFLDAQKLNNFRTGEYRVINEAFDEYNKDDVISESDYSHLSATRKPKCSNTYEYVNSFDITIKPTTSVDIRFYKRNKTADYTFPSADSESIITIS